MEGEVGSIQQRDSSGETFAFEDLSIPYNHERFLSLYYHIRMMQRFGNVDFEGNQSVRFVILVRI